MSVINRSSSRRLIVIAAIVFAVVSVPLVYSRNRRKQTQNTSRLSSGQRITRISNSQTGSIDRQNQISESGKQQIGALIAEKDLRTPTQQKIDSQLLQAVRESRGQQMVAGVNLPRADVKADDTGKLAVDISATVSDDLLGRIRNLGGQIIYPSTQYSAIRADINLSYVETIAAFPEVAFVQPAVLSKTNRITGISANGLFGSKSRLAMSFAERAERVRSMLSGYLSPSAAAPMFIGNINTEGDRTHRADEARGAFGASGQSIRIGVLSDSFGVFGTQSIISAGNLPGVGNPYGKLTPVTVIQDTTASDEGAAMLQIVHDIAPDAQLFFATAQLSEANFAANILALRNAPNNCDIIIDDTEYFDEPPFQDGIVAQAVNTVAASGALYFSSAGNEGSLAKNTSGVWEGDFDDTGSTLTIPGNGKPGTVLNFGNAASPIQGNTITSLGDAYTLSWADPLGKSDNDYDLFLMDSTLTTVKASATNIQNGTQNPFERVSITGASVGDKLVVFKSSTAAFRAIHLNTFGGTLAVATSGQTHGHSAATGAFSVAATPAATAVDFITAAGPYPNPFSASNQAEKFSSDGPRRVFFNPDGTPITPNNFLFGALGGELRNKPDITAADGVSIQDGSVVRSPFFGTSAAAPHAGAIAALIKSANPSLTPDQIKNILLSTALDIESPGPDNISGVGIIQAFQALQSAQPNPSLHLSIGTVITTESQFSNHNGSLEPGETVDYVVQLNNFTGSAATNVKATLTGPNTAFAPSTVSYGTIPARGSASNAATPFKFGIPPSPFCGAHTGLVLNVSYDGAGSPQQFYLTLTTGHPMPTISATLGHPGAGSGFTSSTGKQTGILNRTGVADACGTGKRSSGLASNTGSRSYDVYNFNNNSNQCVTVTLDSPNGANLYVAAYTSYNSDSPGSGQIAASGSSGNHQVFSFTSTASFPFSIVVHEVDPGTGANTPYALSLSLPSCNAGPTCGAITISPPSIPDGEVGKPYPTQTFVGVGGSGSNTLSLLSISGLPAGMNLTGNTLSGTPTQAGFFTFSASVNDTICSPRTFGFPFLVSGNEPGSINISSGDGQSASPGSMFPQRLRVIVHDKANKPLPGVKVNFRFSDENSSSSPSSTFVGEGSAVTDANGIATSSPFTANNVTGTYGAFAAISGGSIDSVVFRLSNSCAPVVTNNNDSGPGSLREAVKNACDHSTVTFAPNVSGTITLTSGEIVIDKNVSIQGPGANALTISGGHHSRVFAVKPSVFMNTGSTVSGLTIRDGAPSATDTSGGGGAILVTNSGVLVLMDSVITDNDVSNAASPSGGAIESSNNSAMDITRCAIIHNKASLTGGGIHLTASGRTNITNTTIAENTVGPTGKGGGVEVDTPNQFSSLITNVTNSTIFGNSANMGGNISSSVSLTLESSIVAGGVLIGTTPVGPDLNGAGIQSAGSNLVQDISSAPSFFANGSITGKSPLLFQLGDHGGVTPTLLPRPDSPVIRAGKQAKFGDLDQRGFLRRPTGLSDIGAIGTDYVMSAIAGTPQSTNTSAPFAERLKAQITESGINMTGLTVTFTAPLSGPSALFGGSNVGTAVTDSNGVATSPALAANANGGSYQVTADLGLTFPNVAYNLTNVPVIGSIGVFGGTPQSANTGAGFQLALLVIVRDDSNVPLAGVSVTFTAPPSGPSGIFSGSGTSTVAVTNGNGIATAPGFTANSIAGSYTVTTSVAGNVSTAIFNLTNLAVPASVSPAAGTPQSANTGATFAAPLQATVRDSNNNLLPGINVTFTAPGSGPSGTFTGGVLSATVATNSSGVATAPSFKANSISGSYSVTVSVGVGVPAALFNLTNIAVPTSISVTAGSPQNAPPGGTFQAALKATARDINNNLLQGIDVTFTAPDNGPSGTFAGGLTSVTIATDVAGIATAPSFTANGVSGTYVVTASVGGNVVPASFSLRNILPGPPASFTATAGTPQTVTIGCDFLTSLRATVLDADGVPVGGITVTFTAVPNGTIGATFANNAISATAITDNNGNATAPLLTANEFAGSYTVTATISELSSTITYNLTNRIKFGDLTGEGTVNVQDLLVMANILAGNIHPTTGRKMMADVFQDAGHQVNVQDLFTMANFLAGNISTLPVNPIVQNFKTDPYIAEVIGQFGHGSEQQTDVQVTGDQANTMENWSIPDLPRPIFRISDLIWRPQTQVYTPNSR